MPEYGIMLLNLGGPDSLTAVGPFLYNLFSDPEIFKLPLGSVTQKPFAWLITRLRSKKVAEHYAEIGGRSPILHYTSRQAELLENKLRPHLDCRVYIGMRYWHPMIEEAVQKALTEGVRKFVLLPLYPQYSVTTTGSSVNEFNRVLKRLGIEGVEVVLVKSYPDDELYVRAVSERIEQAMSQFSAEDRLSMALIFSAHSLPVSFIANGDPYLDETKRSVAAVLSHLRTGGINADVYRNVPAVLSFQSKVGPVMWLEPATEDCVRKLAGEGIKNLLVVPISFVSDHIETLHELEIELRATAEQIGIKRFVVAQSLNDSDTFVAALKTRVLKAVKP
jgi:ferrochelatase